MITFRITVQKQRTDGLWPVYIRVTHNRKTLYIKTTKIVDNKGLNKNSKEVKDPFVRKLLDVDITRYVEILNKVDTSTWTVQEVVDYIEKGTTDICFSEYARQYQTKMIQEGHA